MKKKLLQQIIKKKEKKIEFAIVTNLANGESCIFEKDKILNKNFDKYKEKITSQFNKKKKRYYRRNKHFCRNLYSPNESNYCWCCSHCSIFS